MAGNKVMAVYRGSCLCGSVRFQLVEGRYALVHCHCSMCRKHHGAAFASYLNVPRAALVYLTGEHLLTAYASSPRVLRRFCSACGSSLEWRSDAWPDWLSLAAGTLDDELVFSKSRHLWLSSQVGWCPTWNSAEC